jgi:hypothetical protein
MNYILFDAVAFLSTIPYMYPWPYLPWGGVLMSAAVTDSCSVKRKTAFLTSYAESQRREMLEWLSRTPHTTHHEAMGRDFLPNSGK